MRRLSAFTLLLLLAWFTVPTAAQAKERLQVFVTQPYLELRTGAGRGYPVFNVVARDESVDVLFRRTDWFKVRTSRGVEGWAAQDDMLKTALADGTPFTFKVGNRADYTAHNFELGVLSGNFDGATLISSYLSYSINPHFATELDVGQYLGRFSDGVLGSLGLDYVVGPEWRWSPFVEAGGGLLKVTPNQQLVFTPAHSEPLAYAGAGVRYFMMRRVLLRAEFRENYVFTTSNENQKVDEWKVGFAFFF